MKNVRFLVLLVAVGLLVTACRVASPIINETAAGVDAVGASDEPVIDPNWHLTPDELAELEATGEVTSTPASAGASTASVQESAAIDEEPNAGADFDTFIMERFPAARSEQYAALRTVVSGYCLGLVDEDSIGSLTRDETIRDIVLDISNDECSSMETSALFITSGPVSADSWDGAVRRRFARTIWWSSEADFSERAVAACQAGSSAFDLENDLDLSLSVVVELAAFTKHGDCALLTTADGAAVETTNASDAGIVVQERNENVTLYFIRASDEENIGDRNRDLYALALPAGEVTRLTTGQDVDTVALSPDGTQLAYLAEDPNSFDHAIVHVLTIASGEHRVIGTVNHLSDLDWIADGTALVHSSETEDGVRVINLLDVATGTSSIIVEPSMDTVWQEGRSGTDLLYFDSDGRQVQFVRHDMVSNITIDSVTVPYGNISVAPDGSSVIVTARQSGEMSIIDMNAATMALTPLPSGPGLEAWPAISPNNHYVAYGVGPEFRASDIFITDLTQPEVRLNLTSALDTTKVGKPVWSPDSQAVFFNDGEFDFESMYFVTVDGTVTDLGQIGRPLLVVNR